MDTEGTANGPMALWTDCGRSSAAVTGSSGSGDRSVVYFDNGVAKLGKGVDDSTVADWLKGEPNQSPDRCARRHARPVIRGDRGNTGRSGSDPPSGHPLRLGTAARMD